MRWNDWKNQIRQTLEWVAPIADVPAAPRAPRDTAGSAADRAWLVQESGWIEALEPTAAARLWERVDAFIARADLVSPDAEQVAEIWKSKLDQLAQESGAPAPTDAEARARLALWIAAHACWPLLELGLEALGPWRTIVLYPDSFLPDHEWVDDAGVVHRERAPHAGEAWEDGPVVFSVADIWDDPAVVIHEVAHVLDGGNGAINGFPPLHRDQDAKRWSRVFQAAYDDLVARLERGEPTGIDPYAATLPEEFFAVVCETFFMAPDTLADAYPEVFRELGDYFRFDPRSMRLRPGATLNA